MWNPKNFKGHVAPHEFMEAVSLASAQRFKRDDKPEKSGKSQKALEGGFGGQADPIQFLAWLLNNLKTHQRVIEENFQGQIKVKTLTQKLNQPTNVSTTDSVVNFFFLSMELPNIPLFKEQTELASLPQIALSELLRRHNGEIGIERTYIDKQTKAEMLEKKFYKV